MKTFTFGGIHGGSTIPEDGFVLPVSLRRSVLDAPTDHRQFHSEDIRSKRYLTLVTMAMVPGTIHRQSHSVGGTTTTSSLLFPPNFDFHSG